MSLSFFVVTDKSSNKNKTYFRFIAFLSVKAFFYLLFDNIKPFEV